MSNSDEGKTTVTPEDPGAVRVPLLSDDEACKRIRDILRDAALKSGNAVDEDEIDAATSSIFDAMKKSFT